jgi:hypothetical protein
MQATQSGALKNDGMQHVETLGRVFSESLEREFAPMSPGAMD